jgi:hypothetical protein
MKTLARITVLLLTGFVATAQAATRSDINILEASENIKYIAQELAGEYAYYYTHPIKREYAQKAQANIHAIEGNIRTIARTTKDDKIRQMLSFFSYEKEQLKIPIRRKPDRQSVASVLDSSDAFAEGASKIVAWVQYRSTFEEKMFITCKSINYLLKKISKYYIVLGSDIDKVSIAENMNVAIKTLENEMKKIQEYAYPKQYDPEKKQLEILWEFGKKYYQNPEGSKIPGVLLIAQSGIEGIVNNLAIYHSKN